MCACVRACVYVCGGEGGKGERERREERERFSLHWQNTWNNSERKTNVSYLVSKVFVHVLWAWCGSVVSHDRKGSPELLTPKQPENEKNEKMKRGLQPLSHFSKDTRLVALNHEHASGACLEILHGWGLQQLETYMNFLRNHFTQAIIGSQGPFFHPKLKTAYHRPLSLHEGHLRTQRKRHDGKTTTWEAQLTAASLDIL